MSVVSQLSAVEMEIGLPLTGADLQVFLFALENLHMEAKVPVSQYSHVLLARQHLQQSIQLMAIEGRAPRPAIGQG